MKDPNVLEAIDLCVNGNPVEDEGFSVQQFFYRLWHLDDAFYEPQKGSHETHLIGKDPEPIIMPKSHKIPPPRNPLPPPRSRTGKQLTGHSVYLRVLKELEKDEYGMYINASNYKEMRIKLPKIDCLSGNYHGITIKDFFKEIFRNSWFTKFKNWIEGLIDTPIPPHILAMAKSEAELFDKRMLKKNKYLQRIRRRRKSKRYSISTPIIRAIITNGRI